MDNKKDSSISEVPTFKVARVGEDRKRKKGGFTFLRGSGPRGSWTGATGGSGAGGMGGLSGLSGAMGGGGGIAGLLSRVAAGFGMSFTKAMLMILATSAIGAASILYGTSMGRSTGDGAGKKPLFSEKTKLEGDTSNLPSNANTIPNSLGYLSGSMDGLTPEERAQKAAEAAAAAEAQRIADEEASRKAEADALAGQAIDPAALLASAKADGGAGGFNPAGKGSAFGTKFGGLSSSMGSGQSLTGGPGLSGGVNRNFGSAGNLKKAGTGELSKSRATARPTYSKAGASKVSKSNVKGFARKQLTQADKYSRKAAGATKSENSAVDAGSAFDNNKGAGNVISGPGIAAGSPTPGGVDSTPNPPSNPPSTPGVTGCAATGTCVEECPKDQFLNSEGTCENVQVDAGKNVTPYQKLYDIAIGLLIVVAVLSAIQFILEKSGFGYAAAKFVTMAMIALGVIIAGLGAMIVAMTGDKIAGGILVATGGAIAIFALNAKGTDAAASSVSFALKMIIPSIVGGFAASMAHKPAAAAQ